MTNGVKDQAAAVPEKEVTPQAVVSDKEINFRKLETAREEERQRAHKAEMEAALLKQKLEMMEQRLQPKETDPLEGVEDYLDPNRYRADQTRREARLKKEAEEIAERKLKEYMRENEQQNHMQKLKMQYSDYDAVVNERSVMDLQANSPEFAESLVHIKDDYERKKLAYNYLKRNNQPREEKPSIKEKVEENQKNPYMIQSGSGTPATAIDFELKTPKAREEAYAKLKAAQKRVIGDRPAQTH